MKIEIMHGCTDGRLRTSDEIKREGAHTFTNRSASAPVAMDAAYDLETAFAGRYPAAFLRETAEFDRVAKRRSAETIRKINAAYDAEHQRQRNVGKDSASQFADRFLNAVRAAASMKPNYALHYELNSHITHYTPAKDADANANAEFAAQHRGGSSRPPASRPKPQGRPLPAIRYGADSVVRRCNRIEKMYKERYANPKVSYSNE